MTASEILILAAERFSTAEIAEAAGLCHDRAQMARAEALSELAVIRKQARRKEINDRYRAKLRG